MEVETALDGAICTEKVFAKGHSYYSIILVRPTWLSRSMTGSSPPRPLLTQLR